MRVSDFLPQSIRGETKAPRHRTTYRAARRNIAKIEYRRKKRSQ